MRRASLTLAAAALAALAAPVLAREGGARRADFAAARDAAFKQADANGDGQLSPAEFATFEQALKQNLQAAHFSRLDANGDGAVSAEELAAGRGPGGCRGK